MTINHSPYAYRLQHVLGKPTQEYQAAFIKARYSHPYKTESLIESDSLILFADFSKVFDIVEHEFIFKGRWRVLQSYSIF